jgi:hypothetical protein
VVHDRALYFTLSDTRFTGSAGTAVISANNAYLFTDSRYWIQAERELDRNWILQRVGSPGSETWKDYIVVGELRNYTSARSSLIRPSIDPKTLR